MNLNEQENAVVLCALWLLQDYMEDHTSPPYLHMFDSQEEGKPDLIRPTPDQIEELAQRINCDHSVSQDEMTTKKIEVIVACYNSQGIPEFVLTDYDGTESDVNNGDHYEIAQGNVIKAGYHGPFVCFDEEDLGEKKWAAAVKAVAFALDRWP